MTFRIVNYGATSSGGTWYVFDVANSTAPDLAVQGILTSVSGSTNPPAAPAVLNSPVFAGDNQLQFNLTGTSGSNYVIQVSTNLASGNWMPVLTNVAPFTFTDTNPGASTQKFYRAVTPP